MYRCLYALTIWLALVTGANAAIALVGTPTHGSPNFTQTAAITLPTGIASGNSIYIVLQVNTTSVTDASKPFANILSSATTNNGWFLVVLRRVSDGTEGSSQTVDSGTGNAILNWTCFAYSGENQSTPEDGSGQTAVGNTQTSASLTGITTSIDGDQLIFAAMTPDATVTFGTPSGFGNSTQDSSNGETIASFDKAQGTHGATGALSSTGLTSGNNWAAGLFAIRPQAQAAAAQPGVVIMQ